MEKIRVKASKSKDARNITVEVDLGNNLEGMVDMFDHQTIFEAAREIFIQQIREDVRSKMNADKTDDEIHEAVAAWKPLPVSVSRLMNRAINVVSRLSSNEKEKLKAALEQQAESTK